MVLLGKSAGGAKKMAKSIISVVVGGLIALTLWFGGYYVLSNLSWKGGGSTSFASADSSITPVGWRNEDAGRHRSSNRGGGYLTHDDGPGCHIKCNGKIIFTFTPTPPQDRCDQLIAEQGQRRCDNAGRR